ncbi:MAG: DUF2059 domain-containing protein [Hyphomicrobiales bacterium]|nr:DUF2059 domain-containing protein [Hyphomicrobiales bacterium]
MKLTTFFGAFAITALLAGAPAFAQAPAPAPAAAEPSAAQIALARDLIVASGVARTFSGIVPQYLDQIGTNLTQTRPDLIRDLNTVREQIKPEFDKRVDTLIDQAARLYAQRFSEDELKQMVVFFKSPAGQHYVSAQPGILNDMFVAMQGWSRDISSDMMTRVREEMKKKGHEL